jgi:predicted nucleic acid-binding protein
VKGVYFADAFFWIALSHKRDAWHDAVFAWALANPRARLVTTEEALTEVLNWFATRGINGRKTAAAAVRQALTNPLTQVLPQTSANFHAALAFYESRMDKEYSLVDCRSMAAMKSLGLSEVLSNDHHFAQEGFTVLFP